VVIPDRKRPVAAAELCVRYTRPVHTDTDEFIPRNLGETRDLTSHIAWRALRVFVDSDGLAIDGGLCTGWPLMACHWPAALLLAQPFDRRLIASFFYDVAPLCHVQ